MDSKLAARMCGLQPITSTVRIIATLFLLILFVLSLVGCEQTTLQIVETVPATSGTDRLLRKNWETVSRSNPSEKSYDSH